MLYIVLARSPVRLRESSCYRVLYICVHVTGSWTMYQQMVLKNAEPHYYYQMSGLNEII